MTHLLCVLSLLGFAADLSTLPGMEGVRPREKPAKPSKPAAPPEAKPPEPPRRILQPGKGAPGELVAPLPEPPGFQPGYEAEMRSPLYGMRVPRAWKGPEALPDGVKLTEPRGSTYFTVRFLNRGSPEYQEPATFRSAMHQKGGIEDSHVSEIVKVGGRFASRVRFTTHYYTGKKFLGEKDTVYYTELIMVPDPDGLYLVEYRSLKKEFDAHRPDYLRALRSLAFPNKKVTPEGFYLERDILEKDLLEEKVF